MKFCDVTHHFRVKEVAREVTLSCLRQSLTAGLILI